MCFIESIEDFITASEAAELSGYSNDYIARLCREGFLAGAQMKGRMWLIPKQSVKDYKPGPQGFAATQAKKRKEAEETLKERNAAIRAAQGLPANDSETQNSSEEPVEYVNVEEAAKILNRSMRTVRAYCLSKKIAGATRKDARGKEWVIPKSSLKNILPSIGVIRSDGTVMPLGGDKDA